MIFFFLATSSYSLSIKNQPLSISFDNQITGFFYKKIIPPLIFFKGNIYIGYSPLSIIFISLFFTFLFLDPNSNYSGFISALRIWNTSLNSTFLENNYRSTLFGKLNYYFHILYFFY